MIDDPAIFTAYISRRRLGMPTTSPVRTSYRQPQRRQVSA